MTGRVLCDVLRRFTNGEEMERQSWVELIIFDVRLYHDVADPESGFSPYQLFFGRDRSGVGSLISSLESVWRQPKRENESLYRRKK